MYLNWSTMFERERPIYTSTTHPNPEPWNIASTRKMQNDQRNRGEYRMRQIFCRSTTSAPMTGDDGSHMHRIKNAKSIPSISKIESRVDVSISTNCANICATRTDLKMQMIRSALGRRIKSDQSTRRRHSPNRMAHFMCQFIRTA